MCIQCESGSYRYKEYYCSKKCSAEWHLAWERKKKATRKLEQIEADARIKHVQLYTQSADVQRNVRRRLSRPKSRNDRYSISTPSLMKTDVSIVEAAIQAALAEKKAEEDDQHEKRKAPGMHQFYGSLAHYGSLKQTLAQNDRDAASAPSKPLRVPELLLTPPEPFELTGFSPREKVIGARNWTILREQMIARYGLFCMICDKTNCAIEMHEVYSYDFYEKIADVQEFLLTCKACHAFIHLRRLAARLCSKPDGHTVVCETVGHGHDVLTRAGILQQGQAASVLCHRYAWIDPLIAAQLARRSAHKGIQLGFERPEYDGWIDLSRVCFVSSVQDDLRWRKPWKLRFRGQFVDYLPKPSQAIGTP